MAFKLNDKFLLGVSTASTQIEGGEVDNNWRKLYLDGLIKDNSNPANADDHWRRYVEDTEIMASLNVEIYRFGVEWARIFPKMGIIDNEAINHYREEIKLLKDNDIEPLLTIHHFSNPMWFEEIGGFTKKENLKYYFELVEVVVRNFGDLVSEYITINEPNVYAYNSFFYGLWYPNHKSLKETFTVLNNLSYAHIKAYEMIHNIRHEMGYDDSMVSSANHVRPFVPKNKYNLWHRFCAKTMDKWFQTNATIAMETGVFKFPLKNKWKVPKGEYIDFLGINYYSRTTCKGLKDATKSPSPRNDLDWEIYPEGLIEITQKMYNILPRPIWVTENGTCDTIDAFRCRYLYEHLEAISKSSLPFERYYHWCFLDNWEWAEGESARFGLVHVDYKTQERTIKKSGEFYKELITLKGVTDGMYEKYIKDIKYNVK